MGPNAKVSEGSEVVAETWPTISEALQEMVESREWSMSALVALMMGQMTHKLWVQTTYGHL